MNPINNNNYMYITPENNHQYDMHKQLYPDQLSALMKPEKLLSLNEEELKLLITSIGEEDTKKRIMEAATFHLSFSFILTEANIFDPVDQQSSFKCLQYLLSLPLFDELKSLRVSLKDQKELSDEFFNLIALERVELRYFHESIILPDLFGNLFNLKKVVFRGLQKLEKLPDSLGNLSNLQSLSIESLSKIQALPTTLGNLSNLQSLYIEGLSKIQALPTTLGNLSNLQSLSIERLTKIKALPTTLGNLTNLKSLKLKNMENLKELPYSVGRLKNLEWLWLQYCKLIKKLPDTVENLTKLETLTLYNLRRFEELPVLSSSVTVDAKGCPKLGTPYSVRRTPPIKRVQEIGNYQRSDPLPIFPTNTDINSFFSVETTQGNVDLTRHVPITSPFDLSMTAQPIYSLGVQQKDIVEIQVDKPTNIPMLIDNVVPLPNIPNSPLKETSKKVTDINIRKGTPNTNEGTIRPIIRPKRLIDPKYLDGVDPLPQMTKTSGVRFNLDNKTTYTFSVLQDTAPKTSSAQNNPISLPLERQEATDILNPIPPYHLELLTLNQNINRSDRVTFVRCGRKENALIPIEEGAGRVILVVTQKEVDWAKRYINKNCDALVIHSLSDFDSKAILEENLGLAGARWLAIFTAAYHLNLHNSILLDDNIESIITQEDLLTAESQWKDIYELYNKTSEENTLALVSSASYRPEHITKGATKNSVEIDSSTDGYKLFYLNWNLVKEKIPHVFRLTPPDPCMPMHDMFLQQVLREAFLKVAKISYESLILQRSRKNKNICAKSYQGLDNKKRSANDWLKYNEAWLVNKWYVNLLNAFGSDGPDYYRNAVEAIRNNVLWSIEEHKKRETSLKEKDLSKASEWLNKVLDVNNNNLSNRDIEMPDSHPNKSSEKQNKDLASSDTITNLSESNIAPCDLRNVMLGSIQEMLSDDKLRASFREPQKLSFIGLNNLVRAGNKQGFCQLATGVGKSRIFTELASRVSTRMEDLPEKRNVVIITPTLDINKKTYQDENLPNDRQILVDSQNVKLSIFVKNNAIREQKNSNIIVICSRSLKNILKDKNEKMLLNTMGLFIFDEMHLIPEDLLQVISHYSENSGAYMLGFSATPGKNKKYFGGESNCFGKCSIGQAIEKGYLCPYETIELEEGAFETGEKVYSTVIKLLKEIYPQNMNFNNNNMEIDDPGHRLKQGIIWVNSIREAKELAQKVPEQIQLLADKIYAYHSKIIPEKRNQLISCFENNTVSVLIAVQTLKEGVNFPEVEYAIIAKRNQITADDFIQMQGRVLRKSEKIKDKIAHIYYAKDIVDNQLFTEVGSKREAETKIKSIAPESKKQKIPKKTMLSQADWKVVPLPFPTSLNEALDYGRKLSKDAGTLNGICEDIYVNKHQNFNSDQLRDLLRNIRIDSNYNFSIVNFYHKYFSQDQIINSNNFPNAEIYQWNGISKKFEQIDSVDNKSDLTLKLRYASRFVKDEQTGKSKQVDHYEILHNYT